MVGSTNSAHPHEREPMRPILWAVVAASVFGGAASEVEAQPMPLHVPRPWPAYSYPDPARPVTIAPDPRTSARTVRPPQPHRLQEPPLLWGLRLRELQQRLDGRLPALPRSPPPLNPLRLACRIEEETSYGIIRNSHPLQGPLCGPFLRPDKGFGPQSGLYKGEEAGRPGITSLGRNPDRPEGVWRHVIPDGLDPQPFR